MPIIRRIDSGGALAALGALSGQAQGADAVRQSEFERRGQALEQERGSSLALKNQFFSRDFASRFAERDRQRAQREQERAARRAEILGDDTGGRRWDARRGRYVDATEEAVRAARRGAEPGAAVDPTRIAVEQIRQQGETQREQIGAGARAYGEDREYQSSVYETLSENERARNDADRQRADRAERLDNLEALFDGREKDATYRVARDAIMAGKELPDSVAEALGVVGDADKALAEQRRAQANKKEKLSNDEQRAYELIQRGNIKELAPLTNHRGTSMTGSLLGPDAPLSSRALDALDAVDKWADQAGLPELRDTLAKMQQHNTENPGKQIHPDAVMAVEQAIAQQELIRDTVEIPAATEAIVGILEKDLAGSLQLDGSPVAFGSPEFIGKLERAIGQWNGDSEIVNRIMYELENGGPIQQMIDAQLMQMMTRLYAGGEES